MNFIDTGLQFDDDHFERRLAALPVPPMPADLAARCRGLIAAGAVRESSGRRRSSRLVLLGSAVFVAAAAAILARQFRSSPAEVPAFPAIEPQVAEVAPVAQESQPPSGVSAVEKPVSKTVPAAADVPTPFDVRVLPLRNEARNAVARSSIEMFHASFLNNLRSIPGLTLITPESTGIAEGRVAPYQLEFRGGDSPSTGGWSMYITAQAMVGGTNGRSLMTLPILIQGLEGDASGLAAAQVDLVRSVLFPQDAGRKRQLQSNLLDRTLDPAVRLRALTDLLAPRLVAPQDGRPGRLQVAPLDDAMIQGVVDLTISPDEKVRASALRLLLGAANPSLVAPLAHAALHDDSDEVALLAVTRLAQDYPAEPSAMAALQSVATDHPRQLVRMAAQKSVAGGTAGESLWRDYVLATLKDANLDPAQRLEPLSYMSRSGEKLTAVLDDEALKSLATLVPAIWTGGVELENLGRTLLNNIPAGSPVVIDLGVEALRRPVNPVTRSAAVRTLAGNYSHDERARKALETVAASDPDSELRQKAAQALSQAQQ